MAGARVVLNSAGVRALLKSAEVQADLEARAQAIADTAGEGFEASSTVGTTRARATVITATAEAMIEEARHRTLTQAIDAGR